MTIQQVIHDVVLFSAFAMVWFLCLLCLLPIPLGSPVDPETGAHLSPMLGRKALIATAIAAVLWLGFYALVVWGWLKL